MTSIKANEVKIDIKKIIVGGHSHGGATSLVAALQDKDKRIAALIAEDAPFSFAVKGDDI